MKPSVKVCAVAVACLVGCYGAHRENQEGPDGSVAPVCGGVTCDDVPAAACADGDTLRTYGAECVDGACSYPSTEVECGASGCCTDHCCAIAPSNTGDFGTLQPTGLVVAPPNGTFDTDAECTTTSALGTCTAVTRPDLPQACVCRADDITIGTLKVKGSRALVLFATKSIEVTTLLDVSGDSGVEGPGAVKKYTSSSGFSGGVGGSFATQGGGASGAAAAVAYGEPTLIPLLGGMRGEDAGGVGGGGGGALQMTAGERIEIAGVINAGGGGGHYGIASFSYAGGAGGGSGGAILVEAPTIVVTGSIVANGGGGGGGGGNGGGGGYGADAGESGFPNPDPTATAYGGSGHDGAGCPLYGYVSGGSGGHGGYGATAAGYGSSGDTDSRCIGDTSFVGGGGGGGGVGRIRINTQTGCQCGGTIAPQASFGMLGKQ